MSSIVIAGDTSGTITLAAPAVAGSNTLTLPLATDTLAGIAATQTLTNKTLTSPVLTTPALGTPASGVLTNCTGLTAAALPAGSVLQVVSTTKTDTFSASVGTTGLSGTVTGLTAAITPRSASNKVLITIHGHFSSSGDAATYTNLYRDSTQICLADAASTRGRRTSGSIGSGYSLPSTAITFLDSPATTSSVTYSLQLSHISAGTLTVYLNRTSADDDGGRFARFTSTITVQEIAG
jgi:hypothetical protein